MFTLCLHNCLLINNCNVSFSGISRSLGPLAYLDGEIIVKHFIFGIQVNTKSEPVEGLNLDVTMKMDGHHRKWWNIFLNWAVLKIGYSIGSLYFQLTRK